MMKELYSHSRCAHARPDDALIADTRKKMSALISQKTARPVHFARRYAAAALCLVILAAAGVLAPRFWGNVAPPDELDGNYWTNSTTVPGGAVGSQNEAASGSASSDRGSVSSRGDSVRYDDLKLVPITPIAPPEGAGEGNSAACIAAFEESLLKESTFVVKAKVTGIRFEKRMEWEHGGEAQWNGPAASAVSKNSDVAVYTLQVEKVYYEKQGYHIEKTAEIVQPLYTASSLFDLVSGLHEGRTYLMPLIVYEDTIGGGIYQGEPTLLYPFAPQVEQTGDGGYLFWSKRLGNSAEGEVVDTGWPSLVNSQTRAVEYEKGEEPEFLPDAMKYRSDAGFERDFQALVDRYCS